MVASLHLGARGFLSTVVIIPGCQPNASREATLDLITLRPRDDQIFLDKRADSPVVSVNDIKV